MEVKMMPTVSSYELEEAIKFGRRDSHSAVPRRFYERLF